MKTASRPRKTDRSVATRAPWRLWARAVIIVLITSIVYLPAMRAGFVWDDDLLVVKNPLLRTWSGLGEIWGFGRTPDYFPLTNTVCWVEWHLFGDSPLGYHVVNILIEITNS